jgi:hypothetical protein
MNEAEEMVVAVRAGFRLSVGLLQNGVDGGGSPSRETLAAVASIKLLLALPTGHSFLVANDPLCDGA